MKIELHPHQKKAIDDMHNGCILAGDVGTGKTITALSYALLREPGRSVYVITTAKKRDSGDWEHEAALLGVRVDGIVVDSWNNIKNYKDVSGAFFIFDEQRLVGTGAWVKSFYDIAKKNHWVLLSATPGDTWLDYVPVFIANGFYKNITEFRQQHVVYSRYSKFPKVEKYINPGLLQRRRKLLLVEMPVIRKTNRHIHTVECDYNQEVFDKVWKKRWNVYEEQPLKDAGELFRVGRKVVNSDSSRLEAVRDLLETHPKLIVFYNFDYELEMLRELGESLKRTSTSEELRSTSTGSKKVSLPASKSSSKTQEVGHSELGSTSTATKSVGLGKSHPYTGLDGTIWESGWSEPTLSKPIGALTREKQSSRLVSGSKTVTTVSAGLGTDRIPNLILPESSVSAPDAVRDFAIAEWNGHKHEEIPKTDSWLYLVQYTSGSEGWNCVETDAMVFYSMTYSYKQFYQSQGRIDRLNTHFVDLNYYVLTTRSPVDKAVWRALSAKKDFNLRGFSF